MMYQEKFVFSPVKLLETLQNQLEFLAQNEWLISGKIRRHHDWESIRDVCLTLKNGEVYIPEGLHRRLWRAITFRVDDDTVLRHWFEKKEDLPFVWDKIQFRYHTLSKNKQKEYQKIIYRLEEKQTETRIANFLMFLGHDLGILPSSCYGFDGCDILIAKISPYNQKGKKIADLQWRIHNNLENIKKHEREIEWLKKQNLHLLQQKKELRKTVS